MKIIDLTKNEDAIKLMAFALDTKEVLIALKNNYIQEIQYLTSVNTE